jgi:uncharacterized protein
MRKYAIWLITCYRYGLSPWLGNRCRFLPSCSEYACSVLHSHGIFYGGYLSIKRILRCHPWGGSGIDEPPV